MAWNNYATDQIIDLIANGVNGIHVYSMNKPDVAMKIRKTCRRFYEAGYSTGKTQEKNLITIPREKNSEERMRRTNTRRTIIGRKRHGHTGRRQEVLRYRYRDRRLTGQWRSWWSSPWQV